ncbi:hypothetical protein DICPUDRAFT_156706 [Dictyostelium purpureum]|uniref:Tetrapyrrole biosynthesis uroporphyrinogen III synthase domain-containing protein n=1 Tax=Dictyostelium purpureum TaxID=5786 RepID=F0ZX77_DICPU|nr:uncharacterized protein DICPUDRAFT_156706 [Dictyostelium purpureum]EGC31455.1 hypothetical protein DICPUDRAFT_156706 [Dictyostelium purpureum]|eukprot:XP_003292024.1 hypothetical protein DICPUDRAFT_156706 [Dictyostelium purpureum]
MGCCCSKNKKYHGDDGLENRPPPKNNNNDKRKNNTIRRGKDSLALQQNNPTSLFEITDLSLKGDIMSALEEQSNDSDLLAQYGVILALENKNKEAEIAFRKAVDADSLNSRAWQAYAEFLEKSKNPKKAKEVYGEAYKHAAPKIALDEDDSSLLLSYAMYIQKSGDLDKAEKLYKRIVTSGPQIPEAFGRYGVFLLEVRKDVEKANTYLKQAADINPPSELWCTKYAAFLREHKKNDQQASEYQKRTSLYLFKNDGFNTEFIKVLKITNSHDGLNSFVNHCSVNNNNCRNSFFGLIFTSSNSIKSLESYILESYNNNNDSENDKNEKILDFFNKYLNNKYIYIVGETSSQLFKSCFSIVANDNRIKSESNAINLSQRIKEDYDTNKDKSLQFLYFCGNNRRDELPNYLKENSIQCNEIIVYNSETFDDSLNSIKELYRRIKINKEQNCWCVFFSPSGVEYILDIIGQLSNNIENKKLDYNKETASFWDNIKIVAIGKTTETSLKKNNIRVDIVSPLPNAQSLFNSIKDFIDK